MPAQLHEIRDFKQLVRYLEDELGWPLDGYEMEDITFDYEPSELGIDAKSAVRIKEIKQLRPLTGSQPWGIFFVNFEKKNLPVVVMRKLLRALVFRKRASANKSDRQAWLPHDLLFISSYGEATDSTISFAHIYEHFLTAYNKKLKVQRGVFYTPQPVVSYIVRSVHELLQSEFGLEHGLADTTTWGEFIQKSKISNLRSPSPPPSTTKT